jgi:hypothetical protein
MLNNESTSCEAQSSSSGNGNDYDLMPSMGSETISVASLQASSLRTNQADPHTMPPAQLYEPDHAHSLMSMQSGALGLPSLSSWSTQNGVPSLTDPRHGWEAASSPASLERILSILGDVMAILDADDTVIARNADTSDTRMGDDDSPRLAFSSSRNMPQARQ